MDKDIIILDSFALMAYFQNEKGAQIVKNLIKKAATKICTLKLCAMNWGEIYYNIVRSKGREAGEQYLILIEQLPIEIVDVDRPLIMQAALLKSQYPLAYADCFAAALANRDRGTVLTGDHEFKKLSSVVSIQFL